MNSKLQPKGKRIKIELNINRCDIELEGEVGGTSTLVKGEKEKRPVSHVHLKPSVLTISHVHLVKKGSQDLVSRPSGIVQQLLSKNTSF